MFYILNHFVWFFVPGLLLLHCIGVRRSVFLLSLAISYSLMMLWLLILVPIGAGPAWFSRLLYAQLAVLLAAAGIKTIRRVLKDPDYVHNTFRSFRNWVPSIGIALLLLSVFTVYWMHAGPYTEIPADIWAHLGRMQQVGRAFEAGSFWMESDLRTLVSGQDLHWYFIATWLCAQSGTTIEAAYSHVMLANSITFLLGIFSFGLLVFRRFRCSRATKTWMAAAAAFFCAAHLGVIVFGYIRYYAMAPAMLNHVVFLAALAIWINLLEGTWRDAWLVVFMPFFMLTMLMVHTQEAVFTAIIIPPVSLAAAVSAWYRTRNPRDGAFLKSMTALCLSGACWCILFALARRTQTPSDRFIYNLIAVTGRLPFLRGGMVLHPVIALEVLTFWGVLAYFLFALRIKWFTRSPVIAGGMLVPFLTYFNPLFVDMLLRYSDAGANLVYRFGYIVPVAFVGGAIAVDAARRLLFLRDKERSWKTVLFRAWNVALPAAFILLLFPFHPGMERQSRLPTLRKVPHENSHELWSDLCSFLRTIPPRRIIADSTTEYVIGGLTHHRARTERFDQTSRLLRIDAPDTSLRDAFRGVNPRHDWLVIINRRDGAMSDVGRISLHWPEDILKVSRHYPDVMIEYIENRPDVFDKIWEQDDIAVYDVDLSGITP